MKIKFKLSIIISIFIIFSFTAPVFAIIQGDFPNKNQLQPVPIGVHANISGNINATSTYNPSYQNISDISAPILSNKANDLFADTNNQISSNTKNTSSDSWYWLIIFLIIIATIFTWGYKKLK